MVPKKVEKSEIAMCCAPLMSDNSDKSEMATFRRLGCSGSALRCGPLEVWSRPLMLVSRCLV